MAVNFTRPITHNVNTRSVKYVPLGVSASTVLTMPTPKGIRQPGTNYIQYLMSPTPVKGVGDPRILGTRTKYLQNHTTITD